MIYSFSTYDQNYCAKMVEEYKLGKVIKRFEKKEFDDFLSDVPLYRRNMAEFRKEYWTASWNDIMLDVLHEKFGIVGQ